MPKPQLLDFDGDFRVNMYRKNTQTTQTIVSNFSDLTDDDNVILNTLLQNNRLTQREIALKLEWSVDRVKYYLQKLKKKGVIKRVGSSHNGYWDIIIKWLNKNFGRTLSVIVLPKFSFLFFFIVAAAMLCFHRLHGAFRADAFAL